MALLSLDQILFPAEKGDNAGQRHPDGKENGEDESDMGFYPQERIFCLFRLLSVLFSVTTQPIPLTMSNKDRANNRQA